MMPSLFISHGSPTTVIEKTSEARKFMMELGPKLPKPEAIVMVSAHWEGAYSMVSGTDKNSTIHDFYGFPEQLFQIQYPAPGAPALAQKISDLIGSKIEPSRGLDHGAWAPLCLMFPEADIPVIQLTVETAKSAQYHYDLGEKLSSLRKDGVMIIGSGSATHNLGDFEYFGTKPAQWAIDYEDWLVKAVNDNDYDEILKAESNAPHFRHAHPRVEHWLPIYVPMGAAREKATLLHKGHEHKNLSMVCVQFE